MADGQMIRVIVYDRLDQYVCDIDPSQIVELTSTEEINGEHSLKIKTTQELEKTNRLVVRDGMGIWHEYVVTGMVGEHGGRKVGAVVHEYYCVWSLQYDLSATYIDTQVGLVPGHPSVPSAPRLGLEAALSGTTRWTIGTITVTTQGSSSFYRRSGWEGIQTLTERWGGEIDVTIEVGQTGVTARKVNFLEHVGNTTATRRFDYGSDLSDIKRKVSDEILPCRIVPLGKSTETEAGGYSRRPTIASANGGVVWLQDASVANAYRIPDGNGGWEYPTAIVKNDVYADPADLKAWAIEHIGEYTRPKVTYEASVVQLVKAGMNPHGVALGDNVIVVDRAFGGDGISIDARVIKIVQSLIDSTDVKLTIGNARESLSSQLGEMSRSIARVNEQQTSAAAYQATAAYLSNLIDRLNGEINSSGGYTYITEGEGIRTYDAEVTDPLVGAEASKVVEIKGGSIRIADSRTASGDWDWKTVFVSGHIAADLVTAAQITAGYIGSAQSGNYWDLDGGTLMIASKSPQDIFDDIDNAAKVATDYLTFNSSTGLEMGYSGTNAKTRVNTSGLEVFDGAGNSALFAGLSGSKSLVRIGRESNSGNVVMSSDGYVDIRNATNTMAHFGWGKVYAYTTTDVDGCYYDLGVRKSGTQIGMYSLVQGDTNTASGVNSFASGRNTQATREAAHAEGYNTKATNSESHAEGTSTTASGDSSHSEGTQTAASGWSSHAEGMETVASATASHAGGWQTIAASYAQTAIGSYNVSSNYQSNDNRYMSFIIGNGTSNGRSNSLYVTMAGNLWIAGTLTQNSDRRLKEHHAYLSDDACDFIRKLRPALYTKDGERHTGFYAQDVLDADEWGTSTVTAQHTDEGLDFDPLTLDYQALIAPLVAYCQHLEKRIEALEKEAK